jgi:serine phosphatase RsbU (regulator of sigma subunit)
VNQVLTLGQRTKLPDGESADLLRRSQLLEQKLVRLRREHDELQRALYDAAQTQRRLCGPHHLRCGPFEIAGEIFPVDLLSGDFLSVSELEGDLVLAIGDIAGKGLAAGLWFTHIVGMVRLLVGLHGDPAAALNAINGELAGFQMESALTSMFLARLDPRSGALVYSNAGHPPALLFDTEGRARGLGEGGPLLGAVSGAKFASARFTLRPGQSLVGYSDGIAERTDAQGTEFGVERIAAAAARSREAGARAILFSILGAVEDFAGERARQDDLGILVVQHGRRGTKSVIAASKRIRV